MTAHRTLSALTAPLLWSDSCSRNRSSSASIRPRQRVTKERENGGGFLRCALDTFGARARQDTFWTRHSKSLKRNTQQSGAGDLHSRTRARLLFFLPFSPREVTFPVFASGDWGAGRWRGRGKRGTGSSEEGDSGALAQVRSAHASRPLLAGIWVSGGRRGILGCNHSGRVKE